jgi:hypothetical protein
VPFFDQRLKLTDREQRNSNVPSWVGVNSTTAGLSSLTLSLISKSGNLML